MRGIIAVFIFLFATGIAWGQESEVRRAELQAAIAVSPIKPAPALKKVLILFDQKVRHIDLVFALRALIDQTGGRTRAVFGLAGIIADIEAGSASTLAATKGVQTIYDRESSPPRAGDAQTRAAIAAWNRMVRPLAARPLPAGPVPGAPTTDALDPPDLPRDPGHQQEIETEYRRQWEEKQRSMPPELRRSPRSPLQRTAPGQRQQSGCGTNGAGYFDTSLYLAGDIVVSVFYQNGSSGGWTQSGWTTTGSTTQTFADVSYALDQFLDFQPNARLVFTYLNEVDSMGNPLPLPANERTHVNNNRLTWCSDFTYMITVSNGGVWPNASIHGPSLRLDITWGAPWNFPYSVRHETGHVFGARDQYAPNSPSPRYGYLMAAHSNACGSGGGYFSGTGECLPDLMSGWDPNFGYNDFIGLYTAGQFGWHDSDGDGIFDVLKTAPVIDSATVAHTISNTKSITYTGVAFDRPLLTQLSTPYGNVSINRLTAVQYRLNGGAWQDAAASDGAFDSVSENFAFTTPSLPNGTYTVEIRAINTVRAVTPLPHTEQFTIAGSSVTSTRPFGALTVTPERAKVGTPIIAYGTASNLQSSSLTYSWQWGTLPWTLYSSGSTSTHVFTVPGTYAVQMRVRNQNAQVHQLSRTVRIESYDTAPVVAFVARQENQHAPSTGPYYSLSLSVAGSRDSETPYSALTASWDIGCSGSWVSGAKTRSVTLFNTQHLRSDRRCVRVRVTDGAGNATEATRFVWIVPYNHRPTFATVPLTFTPSGPNYIVTANATDADSSTTWDGILEYRFDFEGDGIWDTKFSTSPSATVPAAYINTLIVEVKDRFHGRAQWSPAWACSGTLAC